MELKLGKYSLSIGKKASGNTIVARTALDRYFKFFGISVAWNNWAQKDYVTEGYMKHPGLYAIVSRITSVAAPAAETFRVYKVKDKVKALKYKQWTGARSTPESRFNAKLLFKDAYEYNDNHPFNDLLSNPNEWQKPNEFLQQSIGFKLLTGNRFLYINRLEAGAEKGKPYSIYNLPPANMSIVPGTGLWEVNGYELQLGSPYLPIPKEYIIHSRYPSYNYDVNRSHLWGQSPLQAASRTLDRSAAAEERSVAMLQNAGAAGVLFNKNVEAWTAPEASEIKRRIHEDVLGTENAGKIIAANGDLGYHNFAMTAVELAILEQEKYSFEMLCNIYKVPPGLFMASANATDNNIMAWNRQLISQAVIPSLAEMRDDYNQILSQYDTESYVDFDLSVFPEMQEDQHQLATTLNASPYLTMNEKRIARGYDEDTENDYMNKYYVPSSLVDLEGLDAANIDNALDEQDENDRRIEEGSGK